MHIIYYVLDKDSKYVNLVKVLLHLGWSCLHLSIMYGVVYTCLLCMELCALVYYVWSCVHLSIMYGAVRTCLLCMELCTPVYYVWNCVHLSIMYGIAYTCLLCMELCALFYQCFFLSRFVCTFCLSCVKFMVFILWSFNINTKTCSCTCLCLNKVGELWIF